MEASDLSQALRLSISTFVRATRAQADALPASRSETLRELARSGPQPMAALAAGRGVSHQTVSRMVGELEQLGLVTRAPNPTDARGFLIAISPHGQAALDADQQARHHRISAAITTALTPSERQTLAQLPGLLDRLTEAMTG
ncbi:MarR family winged helix-turn-helix transcriptional regulator [Kineosporia succinea]|uniref:DNA-binding MarR family transcriptional regulator n=1 Tax=Kineosporia succinea TaxID=84632 RepID=A0ABT9PAB5_9ACTN|nr:MarR family transcriptional regulator [Kineosporia succinea]MDP9829501.1 DNA-binding MarR family transcriptional regulator [Kineosporia succinea]